jgi:hypothetical protein
MSRFVSGATTETVPKCAAVSGTEKASAPSVEASPRAQTDGVTGKAVFVDLLSIKRPVETRIELL